MVSAISLRPLAGLAAPVKAVARRFPRLNAGLWNLQYRLGMWEYLDAAADGGELLAAVGRHAPAARILDLGCGTTANLPLRPGSYRHYHGVDISAQAIARARALGRPAASYETADILAYQPREQHDAILLREVLYYLPPGQIAGFLRRLAASLAPGGKIFIQAWAGAASAALTAAIRDSGLASAEERLGGAEDGRERTVIVLAAGETMVSPRAGSGTAGSGTAGTGTAGTGTAGTGTAGTARRGGPWPRRATAGLRPHRLFLAVLAAAAVLRAVVMLGYPPVMWFNDSYTYVADAVHRVADQARPSGYPMFLWLLLPFHSFLLVALMQHLLGLATGTGIYLLLRRRGLPAWGATLAAVPVLFDAYQVQLEQQVMSDTLFLALLAAAVTALCWNGRPSARAAAAAGALIGMATVVRSAGEPLLIVVALCLLVRRVGWRPLLALAGAGAATVGVYVTAFYAHHGTFQETTSDGVFLYGRVMSFADCATIKPPPSLAVLCDPRPPARRAIAAEYIWAAPDPLYKQAGPSGNFFTARINTMARQFAGRAIVAQPLDYARVVAADTWRAFAWTRTLAYDRQTDILYLFSDPPPQIPSWAFWRDLHAYQPGVRQPVAAQPFAGFLGGYQRVIYLRGTLLGLILLAGLAGIAARWRRWGGQVLLPWAVAMALLVLPVALSGFSYRYLLAVTPFACIAAGLACARGRPVPGVPG